MALKLKNKYEYQSPTFRRLIAEGKALGLSEEESIGPALRAGFSRMRAVEEGRISGRLEALELVLGALGFHVDESVRRRLESSDPRNLNALVVRALSVESLDELFEA